MMARFSDKPQQPHITARERVLAIRRRALLQGHVTPADVNDLYPLPLPIAPTVPDHGTADRYAAGCRCVVCVDRQARRVEAW